MQSQVILSENDDFFFRNTAFEILGLIIKTLDSRSYCRIVMGGGRTPAELNKQIVSLAQKTAVDWQRVTFFLSDERCVPPQHQDSNYNMLCRTLLEPLRITDRCVRIKGELQADDAARDYECILTTHGINKQHPFFDLALLGLGEDGHTASLFPGSPALNEQTRYAVSAGSGPEGHQRVTLTYPSLNNSRNLWVLVRGKEKQMAVNQILSDDLDLSQCPALGLRPKFCIPVYFLGPGLKQC